MGNVKHNIRLLPPGATDAASATAAVPLPAAGCHRCILSTFSALHGAETITRANPQMRNLKLNVQKVCLKKFNPAYIVIITRCNHGH